MREDLESLRGQAQSQSQDFDPKRSMERRLQLCMNEISRLRSERKKLMDVNNELRVALQKTQKISPALETDSVDLSDQRKSTESTDPPNVVVEGAPREPQFDLPPFFGIQPFNSSRVTPSQLRALENIKKKNHSLVVLAKKPARRVMNYANRVGS